MSDRTDITVPADPRQVRILRLVVAGTLSLHPVGGDVVEDVRAAVGEACALVLGRDGVPGTLELAMRCGPDRVEVAVAGRFASPPVRLEADRRDAEQLLGVFVDDHTVDTDHDRVSFTRGFRASG